jgi:hypothetical protein
MPRACIRPHARGQDNWCRLGEGRLVAARGTLTIRFVDGARRSVPFSADAAQRLADALVESQTAREWIVLHGLPADGRLLARRAAVQSFMWEADPTPGAGGDDREQAAADEADGPTEADRADGADHPHGAEDEEDAGDADAGDADLVETLREVGRALDPRGEP